jgi:MSHA pilin protein MshC
MDRALARQQSGFTLIELVTVLILLGILAGTLYSRGAPSTATLNAQADQLARTLRHTQSLSLAQGRSLTLDVQSATSYIISDGGATITDPQGIVQTHTLVNGVTLAGGDLDFDSLGRPIDATDNLITTARTWTLSVDGSTASVRVEPLTGFVSVTP